MTVGALLMPYIARICTIQMGEISEITGHPLDESVAKELSF
jgi:hypothetical protein